MNKAFFSKKNALIFAWIYFTIGMNQLFAQAAPTIATFTGNPTISGFITGCLGIFALYKILTGIPKLLSGEEMIKTLFEMAFWIAATIWWDEAVKWVVGITG